MVAYSGRKGFIYKVETLDFTYALDKAYDGIFSAQPTTSSLRRFKYTGASTTTDSSNTLYLVYTQAEKVDLIHKGYGRLLMLLGLLIGVLYCLHILAQDYQAITAPKLLRLLFKRDLNSDTFKPTVRWKKILKYDPIQCARYLYCDVGARLPDNELRRGFIYMLTLDVKEEDKIALVEFKTAYYEGKLLGTAYCSRKYLMCPFKAALLFDLVRYMLHHRDYESEVIKSEMTMHVN